MKHIFILDSDMINHNSLFKFRKMLSQTPNFEHLVFTTEYSTHEKDITAKMCNIFNDEEIRFYCYGDVRTLGNIISAVPDLTMAEFTLIPSDCSVDFLKNFVDTHNSFYSLDSLINGKTEYIDYLDMGPGLKSINSILAGLGSIGDGISSEEYNLSHSIDKFMRKLSINLSNIVYILCQNITFHRLRDYKITIDGKNYDGKYSFVLFQNGNYSNRGLKFFDDGSLVSGNINIMLIKEVSARKLFKILNLIKHKNYDKLPDCVQVLHGRRFTFESTDNFDISFVIDGVKHSLKKIQGEIKPKKLKFIIPKSVSLNKE